MFDPRTDTTPPVPDLTGMLANRERMSCPILRRAHAGVELNRLEAEIRRAAEAEIAKARIMFELERTNAR